MLIFKFFKLQMLYVFTLLILKMFFIIKFNLNYVFFSLQKLLPIEATESIYRRNLVFRFNFHEIGALQKMDNYSKNKPHFLFLKNIFQRAFAEHIFQLIIYYSNFQDIIETILENYEHFSISQNRPSFEVNKYQRRKLYHET